MVFVEVGEDERTIRIGRLKWEWVIIGRRGFGSDSIE